LDEREQRRALARRSAAARVERRSRSTAGRAIEPKAVLRRQARRARALHGLADPPRGLDGRVPTHGEDRPVRYIRPAAPDDTPQAHSEPA